ncbi:MAG: TonB family protein [Sinobacteraceae bacterium]|nr:TonB family protein [Nevskiaceae bacterium]MBV9913604.1 TonB family protein [Nevskiaceae bacterium]
MLKSILAFAASACACCVSASALPLDTRSAHLEPAQLRSLPRHLPPLTYYPVFARLKKLEGRLLIEFRLDAEGNTVDAHIVQADADRILRATALRLVQGTSYEVGSLNIDSSTRFRTAVIYCLTHCGSVANYPDADASVQITAGPQPQPGDSPLPASLVVSSVKPAQ